jgi:hypothetical protein
VAQFLPNGIEHGFAFWGKTAQDQHRFGGNGVDDLANLLVVEQQVDKLGHFDIVHRDHRLIKGGDNQIRLVRLCEVDVPRGNPIDRTPREIRPFEAGLHQESVYKGCPAEVRFAEVRLVEVRLVEARAEV